MTKFFTLLGKELRLVFASPIAYVIVAVFLALMGYTFTITLFLSKVASLAHLFFQMYVLLLLMVPAITMRLFAEERKTGTLEVLLTSPVSEGQVVLAKFSAAFVFYVFLWVPTLAYVAILAGRAKIDYLPVASGYLGIFLLGLLFISVGLLTSALVRNQIIAAILAFAILIVIFSVGLVENLATAAWLKGALGYMNLWNHMDDFGRGIVDTRHVVYNLSLTAFFVFLATRALEASKGR